MSHHDNDEIDPIQGHWNDPEDDESDQATFGPQAPSAGTPAPPVGTPVGGEAADEQPDGGQDGDGQ